MFQVNGGKMTSRTALVTGASAGLGVELPNYWRKTAMI